MFKKLFLMALGLGVAGIFVFGSGFGSYVETAAGMVKEKVRGSIPLEFEIRRAEELIEGIVPEIRACKRVVAEEEVEVEHLAKDIAVLTKAQNRNRETIDVQRAALTRSDAAFFFGGKRYNRASLQTRLEQNFDEFKSNESLLESKVRLHQARLASLEAAKEKLENVRLQKGTLENQVQSLYAQLRQVEAMEAHANKFSFDDTKLARAKSLLDRCKKSLDVAQKMIENDRDFSEGFVIIEDEEYTRNIVDEVNRYFANHDTVVEGDEAPRLAQAGGDL